MSLDEVARFIDFQPDLSGVPPEEDRTEIAMVLVKEADEIKAAAPRKTNPWEFDQAITLEVLPRYLFAIELLDAHIDDTPGDDKARVQRAGYITDVGLCLMAALLSYRGRRRTGDLGADDLARARALSDLAISTFLTVPADQRDEGNWYNLGSLYELSGRVDDAIRAFERSHFIARGNDWSKMAAEALADVRAGKTTPFP